MYRYCNANGTRYLLCGRLVVDDRARAHYFPFGRRDKERTGYIVCEKIVVFAFIIVFLLIFYFTVVAVAWRGGSGSGTRRERKTRKNATDWTAAAMERDGENDKKRRRVCVCVQVLNLFRFAQSGRFTAIPGWSACIKIVQFTTRCARKAAEKQPNQIYYAAVTDIRKRALYMPVKYAWISRTVSKDTQKAHLKRYSRDYQIEYTAAGVRIRRRCRINEDVGLVVRFEKYNAHNFNSKTYVDYTK